MVGPIASNYFFALTGCHSQFDDCRKMGDYKNDPHPSVRESVRMSILQKSCVCNTSHICCQILLKMCRFSCHDIEMFMGLRIFHLIFFFFFWGGQIYVPFYLEYPFAELVFATPASFLLDSFEVYRFSCYGMKCTHTFVFYSTILT